MRILGVDPGTATVGFGCLDVLNARQLVVGQYGVIKTAPNQPLASRLRELYDDLQHLVANLQPNVMAVEELFFFRNVNTAMPVAQARGVIILCAAQAGIPVAGYTPMQVKLAVSGHGRATKQEVQWAVQSVLGLDKLPRPDDAADALAIALAHWQHQAQSDCEPGGREGA